MKLSLIVLCLSVPIKLVCGSLLEIAAKHPAFWDFSRDQTLEEFKTSVEQMVKNGCQDLLVNISSMHTVSLEKRVWYIAAYYNTDWQASAGLVSSTDLDSNIYPILIADNPDYVDSLPASIRSKIMNPVKLAQYDAVGLAKTWPELGMFTSERMKTFYRLEPLRILELQRKRVGNFDLESAIKDDDTSTLDEYIRLELWTPCMNAVHSAILHKAEHTLLYLVAKVKKVPSAYWLSRLMDNRFYKVFECLDLANPGWGPKQEDVDEACAYGCGNTLELYFFMNPNLRPSSAALLRAQVLNYSSVLEFCLTKWYQHCVDTLKPECVLRQSQIDKSALRGHWHFLNWCADQNPMMNPPSEDTLETAHACKQFKVVAWAYSRFPNYYSRHLELPVDSTVVIHNNL